MTKQLFAIFGNPVSHSKSPMMHNLAFEALGLDACYGRYLLKNGKQLRDKIFELGLKGINITVPHKEYAYHACNKLDGFAKRVGAVNTIVRRDDKLYGYNTDASGFLKAIENFAAKKVLFIGAGGTAQSSSVILREADYEVTILNRSIRRLDRFREDGFECYSFDDFVPQQYDLVINMTSAGLEDDFLPAPKSILDATISQTKACVDVIYGKETPFLKLAKIHNKPIKDGSDMLLYQGIIAFEYFTENKYSFDEIKRHMKKAFDFN
ncbi:MAG: shikimate dehydrogenase [Sulfurovum sp.]|nr:shikimate dehydrogenase [Sulfurovum sp.]